MLSVREELRGGLDFQTEQGAPRDHRARGAGKGWDSKADSGNLTLRLVGRWGEGGWWGTRRYVRSRRD